MKDKKGCALGSTFYLLVLVWALAGFVIAYAAGVGTAGKIGATVVMGIIGVLIGRDGDCYGKNGNSCPPDKPYPVVDIVGQSTGECSAVPIMS